MEAFCLRCRESISPKSPKKVRLANGMYALQGKCPQCGAKVSRILPKK